MNGIQSVFYNTDTLTIDQKISILEYAKSVCSNWRVDQKHHMEWARTPVKMSFSKIISKLKQDSKSHFVVIHRPKIFEFENEHFEIGFSTMCLDTDYFLFIYGELLYLDVLIKKYNLEVLK